MTSEIITLPDGSQAVLIRSMDYGEVVIILLLVAVVFLLMWQAWRDSWRK
jgi:hypothetical protein